jgi:hypothetical protein
MEGYDILKVEDLTRLEIDVRERMMITYEFLRTNMPGFEECFIMITAPQIGGRGSRRMIGEYVLTEKDIESGVIHQDAIIEFAPLRGVSPVKPHVFIPYRALLPKKIQNLIIAGRMLSSDEVFNDDYCKIANCIIMGQAAGTAAALAVRQHVHVRDVDTASLLKVLLEQCAGFPTLMEKEGFNKDNRF